MFDSLTSKLGNVLGSLRSRGKISSADIDSTCAEIHQSLLEADVALSVVNEFIELIRTRSLEVLPTLQSGTNQAQAIFEIINQALIEILGGQARRVRYSKQPPTVIMLAGLQGAGKTTLAGKLAKHFADQSNTPLLVASDLQRPNAVTQLKVLGESIGIPVFAPEPGNGVGSALKVAKDGVAYAKSKGYNFVIVDTAGRLGVDQALMNEAKAIRDAINPNEIIFVVDAMMGQDAVSIAHLTKRPIMFASTGEKIADFDVFYPERMASRILGMGDVATLAEQAKKAFDSDSAQKMETKFASGEDFTLEDFLEQMQAMTKMGSMTKMLSMLPGGASMKKQIENFDEGEIVRTQAIVQSMTPTERRDPKILNGSRRSRIAMGAGRAVSEVNSLVERFTQAQKMMRQMRNGGTPQGLPPAMMGTQFAGAPGKSGSKPPMKKKSKSGNPAKRAQEERG